jgi:hypothetical protein
VASMWTSVVYVAGTIRLAWGVMEWSIVARCLMFAMIATAMAPVA